MIDYTVRPLVDRQLKLNIYLLGRKEDEVLRKAREVDHQERGPRGELDDEIAVGDRVERVGGWLAEPERLRQAG